MAKKTLKKGQTLTREESLQAVANDIVASLAGALNDNGSDMQIGDRIIFQVTRLQKKVEVKVLKTQILRNIVEDNPISKDRQEWNQLSQVPWPTAPQRMFLELREKHGKLPLSRIREFWPGFNDNELIKARTIINNLNIPVQLSVKKGFLLALPKTDLR